MAGETPIPEGAEIIGEIVIRTVIDGDGDLAYTNQFIGLNDMEIVGLLVTVMAKHVGRMIRLLPRLGEEE